MTLGEFQQWLERGCIPWNVEGKKENEKCWETQSLNPWSFLELHAYIICFWN